MIVKVVYDNNKDKELLDIINLTIPFFIEYFNTNTIEGRKKGFQITSHWGTKTLPFIEVEDNENKIIKVFYSENGNAIQQLIKWLND